jgi:hypothetical protein
VTPSGLSRGLSADANPRHSRAAGRGERSPRPAFHRRRCAIRINVYSQELTKEVEVVSKRAEDTGITYHGVRLYLASPDLLHHTAEDDDRSAITFWIPHARSFSPADLAAVFREMAAEVERVEGVVQSNGGAIEGAQVGEPGMDIDHI